MLAVIEQVSHRKVEIKTKWECSAKSGARGATKMYNGGQRSHFSAPIFRFFQEEGLGFTDFKAQEPY